MSFETRPALRELDTTIMEMVLFLYIGKYCNVFLLHFNNIENTPDELLFLPSGVTSLLGRLTMHSMEIDATGLRLLYYHAIFFSVFTVIVTFLLCNVSTALQRKGHTERTGGRTRKKITVYFPTIASLMNIFTIIHGIDPIV